MKMLFALRAFIYTARRALSAHLFATLVQYEYKWMHIYNKNTQAVAHTHTQSQTRTLANSLARTLTHTQLQRRMQSRAIITVLCVKSTQQQKQFVRKTKKKINSQPHREIQWKQTNAGGSCRCQQPTTIQHEELKSSNGNNNNRKQKTTNPAFNSSQ